MALWALLAHRHEVLNDGSHTSHRRPPRLVSGWLSRPGQSDHIHTSVRGGQSAEELLHEHLERRTSIGLVSFHSRTPPAPRTPSSPVDSPTLVDTAPPTAR